jgi:hypothetical protein
MIVKKTCRNKLTAFINTANRYNHASPDIILLSPLCVNALSYPEIHKDLLFTAPLKCSIALLCDRLSFRKLESSSRKGFSRWGWEKGIVFLEEELQERIFRK